MIGVPFIHIFVTLSVWFVRCSHSSPATIPKLVIQLDSAFEVEEAQSAVRGFYTRSGLPNVNPEVIQVGDFFSMVVPAGDDEFMIELNKLGPVRSVEKELKWSFAQAPQNLVRIEQRRGGGGRSFGVASNAGAGVHIYVLDSGCNTEHPDLIGRSRVVTAMGPNIPLSNPDLLGHGTHVAATAAGSTYGIARGANIVCVQVVNSHGSYTGGAVLRGLGMVSDAFRRDPKRKIVVNMSLSGPGGGNSATNEAVNSLVRMGVAVVVAAGNESKDACNYSPAAASMALTVGAMESTNNEVAAVSNLGACVDIFAPGVNVLSADMNGGGRLMTGTSMASPHVAGAMAVFMARNMNNVQAANYLLRSATKNILTGDLRGSPDLMLFLDPNNTAPISTSQPPVSSRPAPPRNEQPATDLSPPPSLSVEQPATVSNPPTRVERPVTVPNLPRRADRTDARSNAPNIPVADPVSSIPVENVSETPARLRIDRLDSVTPEVSQSPRFLKKCQKAK